MKKLLSIAFLALPLAACTTETVVKKVPPPGEGAGAEQPTDETNGATPGTGETGESCACPAHCDNPNVKGKPTCNPAPAPASLEGGVMIGKFGITGFEYWQWKKEDPYNGGNNVAWGYNGDGEPKTGVKPSAPSKACMAEAYKVLRDILENDVPAELKALESKHGVHLFWNWNNDMTDAPASKKIPAEYDGLWLYAGDRGDGGLIKWISATERDGTCRLPNRDDLVAFAKACQTDFPSCGSGK